MDRVLLTRRRFVSRRPALRSRIGVGLSDGRGRRAATYLGGCPRGPQRHLNAATRHEAATRAHGRSAAFWAAQGEIERAKLQRDLAEHERRGAALERRWAVLIERGGRFAGGTDLDAPGGGDGDDGLDRREIALEMRETEIVIRERQVDDRDSFGDGRDAVADKRDREADERERAADLRERLADGAQLGTARLRRETGQQ